MRNLNNEKYLIAGNLSNNQVNFNMKQLGYKDFEIIVKNYEELEEDKLKPWECRMYKITKKV